MNLSYLLRLAGFVALSLATAASAFRREGRAGSDHPLSKISFGDRSVGYETYGDEQAHSTIVLLHGTSGPDTAFARQQAMYFAQRGFRVLLLHYFEATRTSLPTAQNYGTWVDLVTALVKQVGAGGEQKVFLVGYSLGASVALAAGSQGLPIAGIADWYGSLPDEFFYKFKGMPPLLILHGQRDTNIPVENAQQLIRLCAMKQLSCESHIYPDEQHGFMDAAREDADRRTAEFFLKPPQVQ